MRGYKNRFAILGEPSDEEEEGIGDVGEMPEEKKEASETAIGEESPGDAASEAAVPKPKVGKTVREQMLESAAAEEWGESSDGENQGVRHFCDYRTKDPERFPALERRLKMAPASFANTLQGFANFTQQAKHVINAATMAKTFKSASDGRTIYYLASTPQKNIGVVVIVQHGKLQTMIPCGLSWYISVK